LSGLAAAAANCGAIDEGNWGEKGANGQFLLLSVFFVILFVPIFTKIERSACAKKIWLKIA
jgi:hypothetical protein